jgi:hypothetical protein
VTAPRASPAPVVVCFALLAACSKEPRIETRTVTLHVPAACSLGASPYGLFYASGDFEPPAGPPSGPLTDVGRALTGLPKTTRSLVLDATDESQREWRGVAPVDPAGDVDVLVLPYRAPCALSTAVDPRTQAAFGAIDDRRALLVGGVGPDQSVPRTFAIDRTTGAIRALEGDRELFVPRARATITPFGAGGIVAGGARPDTGEHLATAEVFVDGAFDGQLVPLSTGRSDHGAVVLASGETLLVGGFGPSGVLRSMEIVDPLTRRARTAGLAALAVPRAAPTVLRLASGEILVAGGRDALGAPVPTLEWFAADARAASRRPRDLVARARQSFCALAGGGALAVIAPDASDPVATFKSVWVLSADGALEDAKPIVGALGAVRLFEGSEGAPVLWTGDRWLRWRPWDGAFGALAGAEGASGPPGDIVASGDPGLALWVDGARVNGLRFATRGPFASTPASRPLLSTSTDLTAPDRLVTPGTTRAIRFDVTAGLTLEDAASVVVTDATFAAVRIDARVTSAVAPSLVLRAGTGIEAPIDALHCPLASLAAGAIVHVERERERVRAAVNDADLADCGVTLPPDARVTIAVRGVAGAVTGVRDLVLRRYEP